MKPVKSKYRAVVIGGSSGGVEALTKILSVLPEDFPLPILVVQHLHPGDDGSFARYAARISTLPVIEPCDKEPIEKGCVYVAPANYHMLVEKDGSTIALSIDERVNWSRPSIDVLFESAVDAWGKPIIGVILSGANADGKSGIHRIRKSGGMTIAQDTTDAQTPIMPGAAIRDGTVMEIMASDKIGQRLVELALSH